MRDIMTPFDEVIAVTPDDTITHCLVIMNQKQFRHLPVFSHNGDMVAMVSMKDLVRHFMRYHEAQVKYLQEYIPFDIW